MLLEDIGRMRRWHWHGDPHHRSPAFRWPACWSARPCGAHMATVVPLARLLEAELRAKLEADVRLRFDPYPLDVQGRAAAFAKLVTGGVGIEQALTASGLLADD